MAKRIRAPDEALEQTLKHPRAQKKSRPNDPVIVRDLGNNDEENPGRPGPSSYQAPQAGPHQPPPVQLPPQQPEQRGNMRLRPRLNRLNVPLQTAQLGQGRRLRSRTVNPPMAQDVPAPSPAEPPSPGRSESDASTCYSQDVAVYDAGRSAKAVGAPRIDDIRRWGNVDGAAEFITSHSGLEGDWVGVRPLGKGGYGIAGLWELRGEDGQVVKQMVVKEEAYPKAVWRSDEALRKVPNEVKAMSKLNKTRCHAIPRLFKYRRYAHAYRHRIYMQYCPFKDLSKLCRRYRRFRQHFPEPFLWDTFYHLVEAAAAMRKGPRGGDWDFEIVHRDLKPSNVFLGEENPDEGFPFYPVAKLGDFGLAVMTNNEDPRNPYDYHGPGTPSYFAPEQLRDDTFFANDQPRLSYRTNIWAIGATMVELLTLYAHDDFMSDPHYNVNGMIVDLTTKKDPEYSAALRNLIRKCVEPDPSKRIKLRKLRAAIEKYRGRLHEGYGKSDDEGKARFESDNRLYYITNEINDMPPGNWIPYKAVSPSKPETGRFLDSNFPVIFPRFGDDGPEGGADGGNDADNNGDVYNADNDDHAANYGGSRPGEPEIMPQTEAAPRSAGIGLSDPVLIPSDTVSKHANSSDFWRRRATGNASQPRLGGSGARDARISDQGGPLNDRLDDALPAGAAREDGGVQGLADGRPDEVRSEGTNDGSQDMDLESQDPISPPPPPSPFRATALATQALLQVPAPTPAPAPVPAPAPAVQLIPRRLRSGRIIGYF